MAFAAERQTFPKGHTIIKQGETAGAAYFLLNGSVELKQGRTTVGQAEPGALLGELAMLGGTTYALTATAAEAVSAVRIDNALFNRVASEYPEFGRAVLQSLSDKLDSSVREFDSIRTLLNKSRGFSGL
jgi:CRP/FNR family transcriptional regulator, cyclic AMP receptor protein